MSDITRGMKSIKNRGKAGEHIIYLHIWLFEKRTLIINKMIKDIKLQEIP